MGFSVRMLGTAVALALVLPFAGGISDVAVAAIADFPQCSDGVDNDTDGRVDYPVDNDCVSIDDDNESIDTGVFVTISDNRDQVSPGDAVIYIITLKQQRDTVKLIDVALHIPAQSSIVYMSDAGTILNTSAFWPKVAVFKGHTRTLTVHVVTNPYMQEGQLLVARVTADAVQATDTTIAVRTNTLQYVQNMLKVSITDNRQNALPNDILDYVISVRNPENRGIVTHVRAGIPPAGLNVLNSTPTSERIEREIIWRDVAFGPNEEKVFSFRAKVDSRVYDRYPIQVTARAGNVIAYDRTIVGSINGGPFSLLSSISDGEQYARRGDLLTYVIHIDNASGRLETNASIDASLPIHSEFVSAEEGGRWDGKNVRWLNMQVAPGGSRDLTFTVRVRSDAPNGIGLRASSFVQGYTVTDVTIVDDNRPASGRSIYSTYPGPRGTGKYPFYTLHNAAGSGLSVEKTVDKETAYAGDTVRYTITVSNDTGVELKNVFVTDNFNPSHVTIRDRGTGTIDGDRIVWTILSLKDGQTRSYRYSGKLSTTLPEGTFIVNTARAVSGSYDSANPGSPVSVQTSSASSHSSLSPISSSDNAPYIGIGSIDADSSDQEYLGPDFDYGNQPQVTVMPRTGVNDSFYKPFSIDSNLSPIGSGNASSMLLWTVFAVAGLAGVGLLGYKFIG